MLNAVENIRIIIFFAVSNQLLVGTMYQLRYHGTGLSVPDEQPWLCTF